MKSTLILLTALLIAFLSACSNNRTDVENNNSPTNTSEENQSDLLNDKNFIFKNVENTNKLKFEYKQDENGEMKVYTDSTFSKGYVRLNKEQKKLLIANFIAKELNVNDKYVEDLQNAYFVSKQRKFGKYQPIIVYVDGDDYGALKLIVLDELNKPLSAFNLSGGMEYGPTEIGDSLVTYDRDSYSYINNGEIKTVRVKQTDYTDTTKLTVIIDSNVFLSKIGSDGKITTKQTVKAHFKR